MLCYVAKFLRALTQIGGNERHVLIPVVLTMMSDLATPSMEVSNNILRSTLHMLPSFSHNHTSATTAFASYGSVRKPNRRDDGMRLRQTDG